MRAYLRLDPHLADRKRDYPDGAFRAFVEALTFAEQQPMRGYFRHEKLLRVLLDKRGRWVPYLVAHGDLIPQDDGTLYLDGWKEWQEGDITVPERMVRLRNRKAAVTPAVTTTDTASDTVDVTTPRLAEAVGGGDKPLAEAHAEAADPRVPLSSNHQPEALGGVLDRVVLGLKNGEAPPDDVDAYVFACRILGYAPNSEDFRAEITALEDQYGIEATVQAEQDVYRIALHNGHRLKPFDLVKDTRTLLMTGKHREERELSAQEKADVAARVKARDEAMLADVERQHEEGLRRYHPEVKP